jgi:hypothetical protein
MLGIMPAKDVVAACSAGDSNDSGGVFSSDDEILGSGSNSPKSGSPRNTRDHAHEKLKKEDRHGSSKRYKIQKTKTKTKDIKHKT